MKYTEFTINKKTIKASAPYIISASRATDIPAFFGNEFIKSFEKGYIKRQNPFNKKDYYISFKNVRVIVFWTKNAAPFIDKLDFFDDKNINYYFQYTLNNYDNEGFEQNLQNINERIETFKKLSNKIGKDKVIWRFDPLILSNTISVNILIERIYNITQQIHLHTEKLVFSFVDIKKYYKIKRRLENYSNLGIREFTEIEKLSFAEALSDINQDFNLQLSTCAENSDFSKFSIEHNKCIDNKLLIKLFHKDLDLLIFLNKSGNLKDNSQRKLCNCINSKDIGKYNTCRHQCIYCYAMD